MPVAFNGFKESMATFIAASGLEAGDPAGIGANDTATACAAGESFCGVANQVSGGFASVQMSGYATLPYTGEAAPVPGYNQLAGDGSGGVKTVTAGGRSMLVIRVDTAGKTVGMML